MSGYPTRIGPYGMTGKLDERGDELLGATFRDPEGWYYLARQPGFLSDVERAVPAFAADGGSLRPVLIASDAE